MIKPLAKFHERDLSNYFVLNAAGSSGALLTRDTTDTSPLGVGDTSYGRVALGSVSVAGDKEMGFLFYAVTATGVTLFEQMASVLDYSVKENSPVAVWHAPTGSIVETDQFATGASTGAIVAGQATGNTAIDSMLGIINGLYVTIQATGAGSVPRAKLIGNGVNNGYQCIRVVVL